jgi:hypothetical protein
MAVHCGGEVGAERDARFPVNAALSSGATGTRLTHDIAARTGYTGAQGPVQLQASGGAFGSALTSPAQLV